MDFEEHLLLLLLLLHLFSSICKTIYRKYSDVVLYTLVCNLNSLTQRSLTMLLPLLHWIPSMYYALPNVFRTYMKMQNTMMINYKISEIMSDELKYKLLTKFKFKCF